LLVVHAVAQGHILSAHLGRKTYACRLNLDDLYHIFKGMSISSHIPSAVFKFTMVDFPRFAVGKSTFMVSSLIKRLGDFNLKCNRCAA